MLTLNDGRSELWQWDTGRKLTVDADCSQVHFSNKVFGRSVDVDVVDGIADIPDTLLQTDKELTAWAFVGTAENGYTKISKVFRVNKRNKPADYVFTEPDQTTLGEILNRIEDLENRPSADISKEDIQDAVNEYLDNNPVSINEKDPTVPDWAKQPNPPKQPDALPNPHKLTFSGAVSAEYDGSEEVTVEIPEGGSGGNADYELPIANPETLGGVKPVSKGADMTQEVGVDELGGLWTVPGGGEKWERINKFSITENAMRVVIDTDTAGLSFRLKKMRLFMVLPKCLDTSGAEAHTGYADFYVNGMQVGGVGPSGGWSGDNFILDLDVVGAFVRVLGYKGRYNGTSMQSAFCTYVFKFSKDQEVIKSFVWTIFNPNVDKPSAMAGATFDVWGVRA